MSQSIKSKQEKLSFRIGVHSEKLCFLEYLGIKYNEIYEEYFKASGENKAELRGRLYLYEKVLDSLENIN